MQQRRAGRLNPAVGFARGRVAEALNSLWGSGSKPLVLVACSGGPDSLALAALTAHFVRRGDIRAGAVIVDHQLQPGSAEVAATARDLCLQLGLDPVIVKTVSPAADGQGPEMAARLARYTAFEEAARNSGAEAILLAHTLDDQAETVLLGLARGSGTRSLAGMPRTRTQGSVRLVRPLLAVRRTQIDEICAAEELSPWHDPTNTDQSLTRARVRHSILPFLEENLGGDVAVSLARTAEILGADANYIDSRAQELFGSILLPSAAAESEVYNRRLPVADYLVLDRGTLSTLHPALQRRVLALAVKKMGAHTPVFERLSALERFARHHSVAGPLQLSGHVSAWRIRPEGKYRKTGLLLLGRTDQKSESSVKNP